MTEETYSVEETMDFIKYAGALVTELKGHKADDGKIDSEEIFETLKSTVPEAVAAVVGSWHLPKELGNLDSEEMQLLSSAAMPVIFDLVGLFLPQK